MRRPPGRAAVIAAQLFLLAWGLACAPLSAAKPNAGHVIGWGTLPLSTPTPPESLLKNASVIQIAAGAQHAVALLTDGRVVAWGETAFNLTKPPSIDPADPAVAISSGRFHSLVVLKSGRVLCWGDNSYGQCNVPEGLKALKVSAGSTHSLALVKNGTTTSVAAWGSNIYGESEIPDEAMQNITDISAGRVYSVAVRGTGGEVAGQVIQWGFHPDAPTIRDVIEVSAGNGVVLAVRRDHSLVAWTLDPAVIIITPPSLAANVKTVSADLMGPDGLVLLQNGKAVQVTLCDGSTSYSQLCLAHKAPKDAGSRIMDVAAGNGFYLALRRN